MTCDLRRLRLRALIERQPGTHAYTLTREGLALAFFYSKLYLRILRPNWPAVRPAPDAVPPPLRAALNHLDRAIARIHEEAALAA